MSRGSRKFWYFIAIGVITLFILILISSILSLGERLAVIHVYLSYAFYLLAGILVFFLIIRPLMIILFSPSLSIATSVEQRNRKRHRVYKKVARRLLNHPDIGSNAKEGLLVAMNDRVELKAALNHIYKHDIKKKINKIIQKHAKTVMISTAISQNGRLDFFTVIAVNLKMIKEIVVLCGFRPSLKHLSRLTINVFTTALIAEGLENLNIADVLPQSTLSALGEVPLIRPVLSSLTQGVSNALLTLRIGIVTRKFLFSEENDITKEKIRLGALLEATKYLPAVMAEGLAMFPKTIFNIFRSKKVKREALESGIDDN